VTVAGLVATADPAASEMRDAVTGVRRIRSTGDAERASALRRLAAPRLAGPAADPAADPVAAASERRSRLAITPSGPLAVPAPPDPTGLLASQTLDRGAMAPAAPRAPARGKAVPLGRPQGDVTASGSGRSGARRIGRSAAAPSPARRSPVAIPAVGTAPIRATETGSAIWRPGERGWVAPAAVDPIASRRRGCQPDDAAAPGVSGIAGDPSGRPGCGAPICGASACAAAPICGESACAAAPICGESACAAAPICGESACAAAATVDAPLWDAGTDARPGGAVGGDAVAGWGLAASAAAPAAGPERADDVRSSG